MLQIRDSLAHESGVVVVAAKPAIASVAEQTAHFAGVVAMIDAKRRIRRPSADRADVVLFRRKPVEFLE